MEQFVLPLIPDFVRNGHMQHAGGEYLDHQSLQFHLNILRDDFKLSEQVELGNGSRRSISNQQEII